MTPDPAEVADRLNRLSPKERECLRLVLHNHSSKQIARQLGVSRTSVDTHVRRARAKLGVKDRYALARLLHEWEETGAAVVEAIPAPPPPVQLLALPPLADKGPVWRLLVIVGGAVVAAAVFGLLLPALAAL